MVAFSVRASIPLFFSLIYNFNAMSHAVFFSITFYAGGAKRTTIIIIIIINPASIITSIATNILCQRSQMATALGILRTAISKMAEGKQGLWVPLWAL